MDINQFEKNIFMLDEEQHLDTTFSKLLIANKLFFSMMEGVLITDTKGSIQFMNPAFSKITGYGKEIVGKNPRILQSGRQNKAFYREMWKSIVQQGQWQGEIWNRRKNGELYLQWTTISRINDDHGNPIYYASVITDITERRIEEQRLQEDLKLAIEVQKSALSKPIKNEYIHIEGIYQPSTLLGGDMYNWYKINDDLYGILLMDVMGHGVASSLVCMSVHSLLRGIINKCKEPELVLQELNNHVNWLFRDGLSAQSKNYYLTCMYLLVDVKEQTIKYASAGHPPGFLLIDNHSILELNEGTVPLGLLPEINVQVGFYHYQQKIKVVLYTDGVIGDEKYSTRENIEHLKELVFKNAHLQGLELMHKIMASLKKETAHLQDDVTMLALTLFNK